MKSKEVKINLKNIRSIEDKKTINLSRRYRLALGCSILFALFICLAIILPLLLFDSQSNTFIGGTGTSSISSSTIPTTTFNSCSLHWNTSGIVVAGNQNGSSGSSASELSRPRGIFIDRNDFLYIADNYNHRIQRWSLNDTSGTTVAGSENGTQGSTSYLLNYPTFIFVDTSLNLYILDMWNLRIQRWLNGGNGGTIIAGTGIQGNTSSSFNQAFTMAVDLSNNQIYLADLINARIMLWPFFANSSSMITPLNGLVGVTIDSSGNIYATSNSANTVTRFSQGSANGMLIISNGLVYPWALRFDIYGNLYVVDDGAGTIRMYCPPLTANSTGLVVASGLNQPLDLAFDSMMNLYVCEYGLNRVTKFNRLF